MNKLSAAQAVQSEIESIKEALGCELELNDEFIGRHCSETVAEQLLRVDESDRGDLLEHNITHAWANGSPASNADGIWVECGEIEIQIDFKPANRPVRIPRIEGIEEHASINDSDAFLLCR